MTTPHDLTATAEQSRRVGFSTRLGADRVGVADAPLQGGTLATSALASSTASSRLHDRDASERTSAGNAKRSTPVILPPAKIDAALAARAARIKRAVAEARGEVLPDSRGPRDGEIEEVLVEDTADDELDDDAAEAPALLVEHDLREIDDLFRDDPDDPDDFVPPPTPDRFEPRGAFDQALVEHAPVEHAQLDRTPYSLRPLSQAGAALDTGESSTPAHSGDQQPDQAVAEAAASVIAAMRSAEGAHERHLESIELEAARRCELLTAQAELDAELIRLHARREAHAIVSAARMRTDEAVSPVAADQLSDIGETFSRFAEAVERTIASGPSPTDTVWD